MCAANPKQYIQRHMLSMSTRYVAVDNVDVQSIETKLNTK